MTSVYLALGSNVGEPAKNIKKATELLGKHVGGIKQAPVYRSRPVGHTDQPNFLNTAVSGETDLEPGELLDFLKQTERELGRQERFHWGPREIDIDIILYGDKILRSDDLTLPHPAFRERDFVLKPLCDLQPDLRDPVTGKTVSELLAAIPASDFSITSQVD